MRLRQFFRKIHRWVGLLSALWLLQLAITGLLLQHADEFGLSDSYVKNSTILQWFDYGKKQQAWDVNGDQLYQIDNQIIIGKNQGEFPADVIAVIKDQDMWLVATANNITWFNQQAEVVQQMDEFDDLPTPVTDINMHKGVLKVITPDGSFTQSEQAGFAKHLYPTSGSNTKPRRMTKEESAEILPLAFENKLSYDKVVHAIHSGLKSIPLLNTLSALALIYLALSGIYLFIKPSFRRKK